MCAGYTRFSQEYLENSMRMHETYWQEQNEMDENKIVLPIKPRRELMVIGTESTNIPHAQIIYKSPP